MLGVSTVDQVGSRLLFRGHGVSPGMRSVHAGLLGNDVVYFLDEVHLSRPFAETLEAVSRWRTRAETTLPSTLQVVTMSAKDRSDEGAAAFELGNDDRRDPTLRRRLEAKKPAVIEVVKDSSVSRDYALRADDPSKSKKTGVPGADWLAFRGLAFVPVAPVGSEFQTADCSGGWKFGGAFTWPLWNGALTVSAVRSSMTLADLVGLNAHERRARGIEVVPPIRSPRWSPIASKR